MKWIARWLLRAWIVASLPLAAAGAAEAQAELSGTYIQYLGVGANGTMVNTLMHSMAYAESGAAPFSCDLYFPGTPLEEFAVEATGAATFVARNSASGPTSAFTTTAGPTVSGRTITWTGTYASGADSVRVSQVFTFNSTDRFVRLDATVTNTGTSALSNVYYLRAGDPDHGYCNIGPTAEFATANDVVRQPPTDTNALVVSTAGTAPAVTIGVGSHDSRARAHAAGFGSLVPSTTWTTPTDPAGMAADISTAIVFRATSLAAGASTTFTIYYVWGPDVATVTSRFDATRCSGCWDGTACQPGTSASACGAGGTLCRSCSDGNACTMDVCGAGLCSNPPEPSGTTCSDGQYCTVSDACNGSGTCTGSARSCSDGLSCTTDACNEGADRCDSTISSGCLISGTCRATGSANPSNPCLVCDPPATRTAWTPAPSGATCSDGQYCTVMDACNGSGTCTGSARGCGDGLACTSDICDEAGDQCVSVPTTGCLIGGACIAEGAAEPGNPCRVCNGSVSRTSWSPAPSGGTCDDGQYCTVMDACNGSGSCTGMPRDCSDGLDCTTDTCDETADACAPVVSRGCLIAGTCISDGAVNPADDCEICDGTMSRTAWSPAASGTLCGDPSCTDGVLTPAPTCDGSGSCATGMTMPCMGGVCADGLTCLGMCSGDASCPRTHFCEMGGACTLDLPTGEACDRAEMCESGFCVDGVCCDGGCDGPCTACDVAGAEGACTPHAMDTDPEGDCTLPDSCDGAGECYTPMMPDAGMPDGGMGDAGVIVTDGGMGRDAAAGDSGALDAGPTESETDLIAHGSSCLCRAPGAAPQRPAPLGALLWLVVTIALVVRRRSW